MEKNVGFFCSFKLYLKNRGSEQVTHKNQYEINEKYI